MNSGCRKLAATLLELHASKVEGKIMLPITTMDSVTYECEVDSTTTCEELLNDLKTKLGMKSIFGFSVFARQFDQVRYIKYFYYEQKVMFRNAHASTIPETFSLNQNLREETIEIW